MLSTTNITMQFSGKPLFLLSQTDRCREILRRLTEAPEAEDMVHARMSLLQLLNEVIEPHLDAPVRVEAVVTGAAGSAAPYVRRMPEVMRAMTSLVDNAVDFAASDVLITARFDEGFSKQQSALGLEVQSGLATQRNVILDKPSPGARWDGEDMRGPAILVVTDGPFSVRDLHQDNADFSQIIPPKTSGGETNETRNDARANRVETEGRRDAALFFDADRRLQRILEEIADLDPPARARLSRAAEAGGLSARGWSRTLRLARTIADLEGSGSVRRVHVAEALIYRRVAPGATMGAGVMAG